MDVKIRERYNTAYIQQAMVVIRVDVMLYQSCIFMESRCDILDYLQD